MKDLFRWRYKDKDGMEWNSPCFIRGRVMLKLTPLYRIVPLDDSLLSSEHSSIGTENIEI